MSKDDESSCMACGACCLADYDDVGYVHVDEKDFDQLTEREQKKLVHEDADASGGQLLMFRSLKTAKDARGNCRCVALHGTVGLHVTCSIYDRRPQACVKFAVDSMQCREARKQVFGSDR